MSDLYSAVSVGVVASIVFAFIGVAVGWSDNAYGSVFY